MRIIPRLGLDDLRFGASRTEVQGYLGTPEETQQYDLGTEHATEAWHYWVAGISCHFDASVDWRLDTLEVSAPSADLHGSKLIGAPEAQLREFLASVEARWPTEEMEPVEVPEWSLNFWLEDGLVESVQWSVPLGESDDEVWPS